MINFYLAIILGLLGLSVGSFISAYTYRISIAKSVKKGRSFCDHCKKKISWYDNIPLLSYVVLAGKCRSCRKKISIRYPAIELSTGVLFVLLPAILNSCSTFSSGASFDRSVICLSKESLGIFALPYLLLILTVLISILVIDFEHKIIPDNLVFILIIAAFIVLLFSSSPAFFTHLFAAFFSAVLLLFTHLITKGRGMGLGDVKLALFGGMIAGWPLALAWLYLSFIIGAIVGLILILLKRAKFGKEIPFGPFLVISLLIIFIWGHRLADYLFLVFRW